MNTINWITFLGVTLAIFIVGGFLWYSTDKSNKSTPDKSLYDRLGGVFAISGVVDKFSDALIIDPVVGFNSANPYLRDWNIHKLDRLPGLKFMRTLWLCAISGGPFVYTPTRAGKCPFGLENAHSELHISSDEFDAVASVLAKTLDEFKVPEREKGEVLGAFSAHKREVVQG